jgi:N-acetylmuramoyl-L-alanine amidase
MTGETLVPQTKFEEKMDSLAYVHLCLAEEDAADIPELRLPSAQSLVGAAMTVAVAASAIAATPAEARTLQRGMSGQDVVLLQQLLKPNYFCCKATGYYGPVTQQAVKNFQYNNGLYADGIVGHHTKRVMAHKVQWPY